MTYFGILWLCWKPIISSTTIFKPKYIKIVSVLKLRASMFLTTFWCPGYWGSQLRSWVERSTWKYSNSYILDFYFKIYRNLISIVCLHLGIYANQYNDWEPARLSYWRNFCSCNLLYSVIGNCMKNSTGPENFGVAIELHHRAYTKKKYNFQWICVIYPPYLLTY